MINLFIPCCYVKIRQAKPVSICIYLFICLLIFRRNYAIAKKPMWNIVILNLAFTSGSIDLLNALLFFKKTFRSYDFI